MTHIGLGKLTLEMIQLETTVHDAVKNGKELDPATRVALENLFKKDENVRSLAKEIIFTPGDSLKEIRKLGSSLRKLDIDFFKDLQEGLGKVPNLVAKYHRLQSKVNSFLEELGPSRSQEA